MSGAQFNTNEAPPYPSPLWIIALFIALSEVTTSVAAITADGLSRTMFTVFAVGFPILVLVIFIWLLIKYPANLYSPWQYTSEVGIETYITALSRQYRATSLVYSQAATELAASTTTEDASGTDRRSRRQEQITEKFERLIENRSVIVDRSELIPNARHVKIPVTEDTTTGDLLDSVYFEIAPTVRPFTYGISWILVDETGTHLNGMGTLWAKNRGQVRDERELQDVGIYPGSRLKAIALTQEPSQDSMKHVPA